MPAHHRSDPGQGSGPPRYPGTFLLAFREALEGMNWKIQRWLGSAVECTDPEGREQVVGLENLYRRARREDRALWPELIAGFLKSVDLEQFDDPPENLAEVAERLLVRLGPPHSARDEKLRVWVQPVEGTHLCATLVVDYPQSMFYVTEQMVAASGRPGREWFERALANLAGQTPANCFQVIHEESGLRQCGVGDAYDSSRALLLDALLPETAAEGYFVALPGRDELLVLPVTANSLPYLPVLKGLAEKSFKNAPYSISNEVFWVQGGAWHPFPINIHAEPITVQPPAVFLEVLRRLMPEDQDGPDEASENSQEPEEPRES
jgi:hypothetical protein